jgi:hypothetical protein
MIGGKRMQKYYWRAFAEHAIDDLRVAALDALGRIPCCIYGLVMRCAPAGAANSSGSSGITIQAMG